MHDCGTSRRAGKLFQCHVWGSIVGIHGKKKQEKLSNWSSTHAQLIEDFVQFMSVTETSILSNKGKSSSKMGYRRHRNDVNV